jgi:APA family basic amino acid/polyamine antiporter
MNKGMGPLLLSGLMIGPILGSGIILLPPMAYKMLGEGSIWAWLIIMGLGAFFAMIFSKLTILHPGEGGMTNAIEASLGKRFKLFSSLLMISAVTFGPTAVMLTASEYLNKLGVLEGVSKPIIAIVLVLLGIGLLVRDIKFISTVSFVVSSIIAAALVFCSIVVLMKYGIHIAPLQSIEPLELGQVVLLLFWAIIGWEIVGNYSEHVDNLNRTVPLATGISIIVVTTTYLLISLAIQSMPNTDTLSLVDLIYPVFGSLSKGLLAVFVTCLCVSTYLLIIGAIIRLASSLSTEGYFPVLFKKKNSSGIPMYGVAFYGLAHIIVLTLAHQGLIDIERIVNIANALFLLNAVIGLTASMLLVKNIFFKIGSFALIMSFMFILSFSSIEILIAFIIIFIAAAFIERRQNTVVLEEIMCNE